MVDPELLEKLKTASVDDRINLIEVILRSLKNDIQKNVVPQPEPTAHSQRPAFGFMKDTGEILGDVVAPVLSETVSGDRQGDYTKERHQWLDQTPLEEILTFMRQGREEEADQYDEIIE